MVCDSAIISTLLTWISLWQLTGSSSCHNCPLFSILNWRCFAREGQLRLRLAQPTLINRSVCFFLEDKYCVEIPLTAKQFCKYIQPVQEFSDTRSTTSCRCPFPTSITKLPFSLPVSDSHFLEGALFSQTYHSI